MLQDPSTRPVTAQLIKALDDITAVLSKVDLATAAHSATQPQQQSQDVPAAVTDELDELALEMAMFNDSSDASDTVQGEQQPFTRSLHTHDFLWSLRYQSTEKHLASEGVWTLTVRNIGANILYPAL